MMLRSRRRQRGATMVEYVLLIALIGVIAITAMKFLGSTAANQFTSVGTHIQNSN